MPAPDSLTPDDLAALLADPTAAGVIKALAAGLGLRPTAASTVPTVRDYHPTVVAAATPGTERTYSTYWKLLVSEQGDQRIDEVSTTALRALAQYARANAVQRRNGQGGASAEENCVAALRAYFRCAVEDGLRSDNPAAAVQKPARPPSQRRALTELEFIELTRTGGDDPVLDTLLLRFHAETGTRSGGALALRLADLDQARLCVRLRQKGGKAR
jgi:site-specific recombinase XerD